MTAFRASTHLNWLIQIAPCKIDNFAAVFAYSVIYLLIRKPPRKIACFRT